MKRSRPEVEVVFAPTLPTDHGNPKKSAHDQAADQLRNRPNTWGLVRTEVPSRTTAQTHASAIRNGRHAAYRPRGAFDSRVVTTESGVHQVWGQYLGSPARATPAEARRPQ